MEYLLSIIIPVYNTKQYLRKCIESVLTQLPADPVEIILINDGSTDSSGSVCDRYGAKCSAIRVIHKSNGGLSAARNDGILMAQGKYLLFLDSDDYLEAGCLKRVCDKILSGVDIYEIGYNVYRCSKRVRTQLPPSRKEPARPEAYLADAFRQYVYEWYAWKYIIKRDFLIRNSLFFPVGKKYEDVSLIPRLLLSAGTIMPVQIAAYHYVLDRPGSITSVVNADTELDKLDAMETSIKRFASCQSKKLTALGCDNLSKLYFSALILLDSVKDKKKRAELYKSLEAKKHYISYARTGPQTIVAKMIRIFGLNFTAAILNFRMRLKGLRLWR